MEYLGLITETKTLLLSSILAILWNVISNLLTPFISRKYKAYTSKESHPLVKEQTKIKEANIFKNEVLELQNSPSLRVERKLNAIHKQLTGIFFFLLSFVFMWLGSTFELFILLIPSSVFIFYIGINCFEKGTKLFHSTTLAFKRLEESKQFIDLPDPERTQKLKESNLRDFGVE